MPKQTTPAFHELDRHGPDHDWPPRLTDLHSAATMANSAYIELDEIALTMRQHDATMDELGPYAVLVGAAWNLLARIDAQGQQLVADWEAEKAADAAAEAVAARPSRCEDCGRTITPGDTGAWDPGASGPRYMCGDCYHAGYSDEAPATQDEKERWIAERYRD